MTLEYFVNTSVWRAVWEDILKPSEKLIYNFVTREICSDFNTCNYNVANVVAYQAVVRPVHDFASRFIVELNKTI